MTNLDQLKEAAALIDRAHSYILMSTDGGQAKVLLLKLDLYSALVGVKDLIIKQLESEGKQ